MKGIDGEGGWMMMKDEALFFGRRMMSFPLEDEGGALLWRLNKELSSLNGDGRDFPAGQVSGAAQQGAWHRGTKWFCPSRFLYTHRPSPLG